MDVRNVISSKPSTSTLLVAVSSLALFSACSSVINRASIRLERSEVARYVIPNAEHAAVLTDVEQVLRESVLTAAKKRAQDHLARTYGWLAFSQRKPEMATKVYTLQLHFEEVNQRYVTVYSAGGFDGYNTYSVDGSAYCALYRDADGSTAWKPSNNSLCVGTRCSSYVRSEASKATCRALNKRVGLRREATTEPT